MVNICMKFHEGILNSFLIYRADTTISQNLLFSISKGHNSKNTQSRVMVLALCTSSHVALHLCKVSWKYLKQFLSPRADTILWQTDTDGQTTRAKTICLPTLWGRGGGGGRHNQIIMTPIIQSKFYPASLKAWQKAACTNFYYFCMSHLFFVFLSFVCNTTYSEKTTPQTYLLRQQKVRLLHHIQLKKKYNYKDETYFCHMWKTKGTDQSMLRSHAFIVCYLDSTVPTLTISLIPRLS